MWLVVAIAVAVFVWFKWRGRTRERAMTDVVAQAAIERIAIELVAQYPNGNDDQILQLIRDELLNRRAREPLLFQWTNLETVGRVRRTLARVALGHLGAQVDEDDNAGAIVETEPTHSRKPFDGTCPACGARNGAHDWKCAKCEKVLPNPE